MRLIKYIGLILIISSCENLLNQDELYPSQREVFQYYWDDFDQYYVGFEQRGVNWDSVYISSMQRIDSGLSQDQFFDLLKSITLNFEDIHVALVGGNESVFFTPVTLGRRRVKELDRSINDLNKVGDLLEHTIIASDIAYLRVPSFSGRFDVSEFTVVDDIIPDWNNQTQGLILDLRLNGGGEYSNGKALASRFIDHELLYARHNKRNGSDHGDFTEYFQDVLAPDGEEAYLKPIVLLTNGLTGSAAELFAQALRCRERVLIVGEPTSGGLGINNWRELPNGWNYRITMTLVEDCQGSIHEGVGITPDFFDTISYADSTANVDSQLRAAVSLIKQGF